MSDSTPSAAPPAETVTLAAPPVASTLDARETLRRTLTGDAAPQKHAGGRPTKEQIAERKRAADLAAAEAQRKLDQAGLCKQGRGLIGEAIAAYAEGDLEKCGGALLGAAGAYAEATEIKYGLTMAEWPEVGLGVSIAGYLVVRKRAADAANNSGAGPKAGGKDNPRPETPSAPR